MHCVHFFCLPYLQNSISLTYFIFPTWYSWWQSVKNRATAWHNLNCITHSGTLSLSPLQSAFLASQLYIYCYSGSAKSWFLHCLLKVIGLLLTAALGSMGWSISSLAACKTWRIIRAQGERWSRQPLSRWNSQKDWSMVCCWTTCIPLW